MRPRGDAFQGSLRPRVHQYNYCTHETLIQPGDAEMTSHHARVHLICYDRQFVCDWLGGNLARFKRLGILETCRTYPVDHTDK